MTTAPGVAPGPVPARAEGLQLLGEMTGSGYHRPPALVRRADGQTVSLTPLLYLTLTTLDGRRGVAEVAQILSAATGRHVTPDDVGYLAERKLRPLGLLVGADGSQPRTTKMNPLLALRFKFVVTDATWTRRLTAPFAWLFRPGLVLTLVAGFLAFTWWLLVDKGLGSAVHQAFYQPGMILALWALVTASAAFHEFGHAAACRYGGAVPGAMGAGLYLVWPAFYTDVTDSYRLGRGGRLRVDLGGLYFNAAFAVMTLGLWAVTRWDALLLVAVAQHLQMVRQLAPFIRADGYHIVADTTGVPDLFAHIRPTLLSVLPRRWRPAQGPALKRWARAVVVLWVLTMVPVLVGLVALGALLLPRLAATAWDSMNLQWDAAAQYWAAGDLTGTGVRAVSSLIVCLPVLGLLYLLLRIARRLGAWAWRNTESSPRDRAAVLLAAAGIAAGVAWAWWPAGQYDPVQAGDEGTLTELVRLEDGRVFLPLLQRDTGALRPAVTAGVTSGVTSGVTGEVAGAAPDNPVLTEFLAAVQRSGVVLFAGPTPTTVFDATAPAPDATTVLGPAAGGSADDPEVTPATDTARLDPGVVDGFVRAAWPFPFPEPAAPGAGDNRAHAVNTLDGAVVMDLAVAWSLVTADQVVARNEAWALASCEDCTTRAVAFQVLLLTTDSDVIAPVNAAVAANYACTRCTTEAIAVQLVMSLTGVPSAEAQQLIGTAITRLGLLEADLAGMTGGQVYYVLRATEAEIIGILAADGVIPDPVETVGGGDPDPTVLPGTETSAATPSTGASAEPLVTTDPTSSPSTTAEPSPSPEPSPDPSPTAEPSPIAEPSPSSGTDPSASTEPSPGTEQSPSPTP